MKTILICPFLALLAAGGQTTQPDSTPESKALLKVKRIYVADMTGGAAAAALRELIIASLNSTKLFMLTDNVDRADAVLKGAADDQTFTNTFDLQEGGTGHETVGVGGRNTAGALYGAIGAADNESHHNKERKHEAYATVRLCNKDGDVLWSTTQESLGAKFRSASADVAAKIARQMTLDYDKARRADDPAPSAKP